MVLPLGLLGPCPDTPSWSREHIHETHVTSQPDHADRQLSLLDPTALCKVRIAVAILHMGKARHGVAKRLARPVAGPRRERRSPKPDPVLYPLNNTITFLFSKPAAG